MCNKLKKVKYIFYNSLFLYDTRKIFFLFFYHTLSLYICGPSAVTFYSFIYMQSQINDQNY